MNKKEIKLGFIGCGHMASAIINGILNSRFLPQENVWASEYSKDFAKTKSEELKIKVITDNKELAKNSNVIFLATKPNNIKDVLQQINSELSEDKLIVSIAAGVSTKTIEENLDKNISVIRVMPNAPALLLEGMSGVTKGKFANDEQINFVKELLLNIGKCIELDESQFNIVTAISGSGPAFFYEIIHEMALAGEKLGLDYNKSLLLAAQTAIGSAKIMMNSELTPEQLVEKISTKGGCTEVGVQVMKNAKTKDLFYDVIEKTTAKAKALGK